MPLTYADPVSTYSDAAFTALEKERVREILGLEALTSLDASISELTADQRKATRYDIDQWINGQDRYSTTGGTQVRVQRSGHWRTIPHPRHWRSLRVL
jgi:hypothetical protein